MFPPLSALSAADDLNKRACREVTLVPGSHFFTDRRRDEGCGVVPRRLNFTPFLPNSYIDRAQLPAAVASNGSTAA